MVMVKMAVILLNLTKNDDYAKFKLVHKKF
jgi:hypothetical protein